MLQWYNPKHFGISPTSRWAWGRREIPDASGRKPTEHKPYILAAIKKSSNIFIKHLHCLNGGFQKWWYPTTMVFWGYHHLRKPPNDSLGHDYFLFLWTISFLVYLGRTWAVYDHKVPDCDGHNLPRDIRFSCRQKKMANYDFSIENIWEKNIKTKYILNLI